MEDSSAPAPRQKNCNNCVQTKRRCDRQPVCARCVEKNTPCVYTKVKVAGQPDKRRSRDGPLAAADGTESLPLESTPFSESLFAADLSFNLAFFETATRPSDSYLDESAESDTPLAQMQPITDAPVGEDTPMHFTDFDRPDHWLVPAEGNLQPAERPSTPVDDEIVRAYDKMTNTCQQIQPWHLYDATTPLYYVMGRVEGFITADMAVHTATPFLHRHLYRDAHTPQCILSCFATSVLYASRTPGNTPMVMRAVHGSVQELVTVEGARPTAAVAPTEKLARTQALFLYQIIRLFDGDVSLRAQGERDIPLLSSWLGELCKMRENLGRDGAGGQPPKEWEKWIFAESVRRTIVMAYSVMTMYHLMRGDSTSPEPDPWAYTHRWTLGRSLWEADSSFEFYRRWRETPHFVIANYSFDTFLKHGRGDDIDDFAEIMLSVYMGVDATKEFMSSRHTESARVTVGFINCGSRK
ncbi:hypothetical protein B0H67DRAFT_665448 [Lasiosphaeris hirsuta]|uniref:Zn(2)-C6 fungal-type domain-containing protein n=1 Tax=Lasiosphaeris hirsuta TaxID=260670 RepID=A0AA40DTA0_9PEZI|nr:hypothetical protein B0H67DRAFT_665448 [Lasiosphaeris hirsuta]